MMFGNQHPEEIKAVLRMRYGTVGAFEQKNGLPRASVSDVLRGRRSSRTVEAIIAELNKPDYFLERASTKPAESDFSDDTTLLSERRRA